MNKLYPNLLEHTTQPMKLEFDNFSHINAKRANECKFGKEDHTLQSLPNIYWSNAIAGEAGELANLVKKLHLGRDIVVEDLAKEIADVVTYCDLFCTKLGFKLSDVLAAKFNEVSDRHNCNIKIPI